MCSGAPDTHDQVPADLPLQWWAQDADLWRAELYEDEGEDLSPAAEAQLDAWLTESDIAATTPTTADVAAALDRGSGSAVSEAAAVENADDVGPGAGSRARFGVGLAALLAKRPAPAEVSTAELVDHIDGWARVAAHAQARQGAAVAELFARRGAEQKAALASPDPRVVMSAQDPVRSTCSELALALRQSPRMAEMVLDDALGLRARPVSAAALERGQIDLPTVRAICAEIAVTRSEDRDMLEAVALAKAMAGGTARQVRLFVRRTAMRLDPAAVAARAKAARGDRGMSKTEVVDDMGDLRATMTAVELKAVWDTITTRAQALPAVDADGNHVALDERRVGVLVDMILHPDKVRDCAHTDRTRWRTDLVVASRTAVGADQDPAELVGYGLVTAATARQVAAASTMRRLELDAGGQVLGRGTIRHRPPAPGLDAPPYSAAAAGADADAIAELADRVAVLLTETGPTLPHRSTDRYRPTTAISDHVEAIHRRCRFPGCNRPSSGCDLDHAKAHSAGGPTCICNLIPLCRRHHLVKHADGWSIRICPDRSVTWTTPTGRRYRDPPPTVWD